MTWPTLTQLTQVVIAHFLNQIPPLPRRRRPPCAFGRLEVNDIFKDLGNLVVEQGEMLDSIEYNMTATSTHVEHGREELGKASRYQVCAWTHRCFGLWAPAFFLYVVLPDLALYCLPLPGRSV